MTTSFRGPIEVDVVLRRDANGVMHVYLDLRNEERELVRGHATIHNEMTEDVGVHFTREEIRTAGTFAAVEEEPKPVQPCDYCGWPLGRSRPCNKHPSSTAPIPIPYGPDKDSDG